MMKILMYPHNMEIGGVQIIARDLAGAVKDLGHEVTLFGPSGPLAETATSRGVRVIDQSLRNGRRPSLRAAWSVWRVIQRERVDLVHAFTHSTSLEAFLGAYTLRGVPLLCSYMGSRLPQPFPHAVPVIAGLPRIQEEARQSRSGSVYLLRPPIDTEADHPSVDASEFRRSHQFDDTRLNVVLVSRLGIAMKSEGLLRAIDAVALVAEQMPLRLIIVGGGDIYDELLEMGSYVNRRMGQRVITFTGPMLDPRPAYAAADIVLGMGTSILRGMAFRKPAIVLGVGGFSEIVTPSTIDSFLRGGFFGVGKGDVSPDRLRDQLRRLLSDAALRHELGDFSRSVVCERFSLRAAAKSLERIYEETLIRKTTSAPRLLEGAAFIKKVMSRRLRRAFAGAVRTVG